MILHLLGAVNVIVSPIAFPMKYSLGCDVRGAMEPMAEMELSRVIVT
jgi:hypothetical protein